jgi:hypothetical protein
LTAKAVEAAAESYGCLPWWACCRSHGSNLPWCARAVLSVVMSGLMYWKGVARNQGDDLYKTMSHAYWPSAFCKSLKDLGDVTGLSVRSACAGKKVLYRRGIIKLDNFGTEDGESGKDYLLPVEQFKVKITPASEGYVHVDF